MSGADNFPYNVAVPTNGDLLIQVFFAQINERGYRLREVCEKAGLSQVTPGYWRRGGGAGLPLFKAALNAIGLDLAIIDSATGEVIAPPTEDGASG